MSCGDNVLIAGAGGRLGIAIGEAVAARAPGAQLILADISTEGLHAAAATIGADRVALAREVDFRDEDAVADLVRSAVAVAGALTSCVNAVGVEGPIAPVEQLALDAILDLYEVNVFAAFRLTKAVLPHLRKRGFGRIVNIASGAGLAGGEYMVAYHSSKHAMVGLTRSVAREVARENVSVNAVCPGCIDSPMMDRVEAGLRDLKGDGVSFSSRIPAGRYATPQEIAHVVSYLALEAPFYLTGTALLVDGGLYA